MIFELFLILFICIDSKNLLSNVRPYTYSGVSLNLQIENCFFTRLHQYKGDGSDYWSSSGDSGGIIFCDLSGVNLTLKECFFLNCSSFGYGACLFFHQDSFGTYSLISKICSYYCWTSNGYYYQFGFIRTRNTEGHFNIFDQSSIYECSPFFGNGYEPLCLHLGNQFLLNNNFTNNKVTSYSSVRLLSSLSFYSIYNSFYNNSASSSYCFYYQGSSNAELKFSNFIKNNNPSNAIINIVSNILLNNLFCYDNFNLLLYSSVSITIYNSSFYHLNQLTSGSINLPSNNLILNTLININFPIYSFYNCNNNILTQIKNYKKINLIINFLIFYLN